MQRKRKTQRVPLMLDLLKNNKRNKKLHLFNFVWLCARHRIGNSFSLQNQHHHTPLPFRVFVFFTIAAQVVPCRIEIFPFFLRPFTSTSLCVYHKNYSNAVSRLIAFKWFLTVTLCIISIPSQQTSNVHVYMYSESLYIIQYNYINAILACLLGCLFATRTFKPGAMCLFSSYYRMKKREAHENSVLLGENGH